MNEITELRRSQPLSREEIAGFTGAETLRRVMSGELPRPPFAATTKMLLADVKEGLVVFTGLPDFAFLNPMGTVHGGWIATILDSAMGCAVHSTLKPGQLYTTTSMTINYVRPLMADSGEVRCEGKAVHSGGRLASSEGRLIDSRGRLIAHGSETCMILDGAKQA